MRRDNKPCMETSLTVLDIGDLTPVMREDQVDSCSRERQISFRLPTINIVLLRSTSDATKKFGERAVRRLSPSPAMAFAKLRKLSLEGELGAEPERRRSLDQQCRTPERILYWRNSCHTAIDREGLIQSYCALAIEDVEPVSSQSQLFTFTNSDRIVNSQVKIHCRRRAVGADALNNIGESWLGSRNSRNDCGSTLYGE